MLYNLIIFFIIYLIVLLYLGFNIFTSDNGFFKNLVNFMGILAVSAIFLHFFYLVHIYFSLMNNFGNPGPKGIKGKRGKPGRKGICTAKCGQQSCVGIIETNINKHLEGNNLGKLDNQYLRDKINDMCFSNNYLAILKKKFDKKPNEKEIIEYMSDICIKWIDTILQYKNGVRFLNGTDFEEGYFQKGANPFDEIKKYEIWSWGSVYKMKPIIRKQCVKKVDDDKSGLADLKLIYTNNYDEIPLFKNGSIKSTWGPVDCLYNQLGEDLTNPHDKDSCYVYKDEDQSLETIDVWERETYIDFNNSFSFYNITPRMIGDKYYFPVGTVWCGTNKYRPKKKTIMLEYNESKKSTAFPERWELIWTNMSTFETLSEYNNDDRLQKKCINCVQPHNKICIWRPIAPAGFMALGDYVTKGNVIPDDKISADTKINTNGVLNTILCVKNDCLDKIVINNGTSVWSSEGFSKTLKDTIDSKPVVSKYSALSIWPCGINDDDEEYSNYSSSLLEDITKGGYNLFRANNSSMSSPPKGIARDKISENDVEDLQGKFGYEIKGACYSVIPSEDEDYATNELGIGWLGGKHRENKYSIFTKLGSPDSAVIKLYNGTFDSAIIQNYKDLLDTKLYSDNCTTFIIQHYRSPGECCENKFVIRANSKFVNSDGNETSVLGYLNSEDLQIEREFTGNASDNLLWKLEPVLDTNGNIKYEKDKNTYFIVKIKSFSDDNNYLYYDNTFTLSTEGSSDFTLDPSTGLNLNKFIS